MGIAIRGYGPLQRKLKSLGNQGESVGRAAVVAGCVAIAKECRDASPGTIKSEVGFTVKTEEGKTTGYAGLMRFPRPGDGQNGPHGVYLEYGTKFITARGFIRAAIQRSVSRARAAAKRAAEHRIKSIAEKG